MFSFFKRKRYRLLKRIWLNWLDREKLFKICEGRDLIYCVDILNEKIKKKDGKIEEYIIIDKNYYVVFPYNKYGEKIKKEDIMAYDDMRKYNLEILEKITEKMKNEIIDIQLTNIVS